MNAQQFALSERLVAAIHETLGGFHPGYRAVHARGRIYRATFMPTAIARTISRALHFQATATPATVRFSFGSGDPTAPPAKVIGMATKFYLENGTTTDLVMLNLPQFPARSPEEVIALLDALRPDATGQPDRAKVGAYLASRPAAALIFQSVMTMTEPTSFAAISFAAFHTFAFVDAAGERRYARYHVVPAQSATREAVTALDKGDPNALFVELETRLHLGTVDFDLELQFAARGDPLEDPSAPWPASRERATIGRLTVEAPTSEAEIGDPIMVHDPTRLTDGIEATNDSIFHARRGAYEISVAERMKRP